MSGFLNLTAAEQAEMLAEWTREYELVAGNRLALDLSRGKPAADQLELSNGLEDVIAGDYCAEDGTDVRNYGGLRGLPEARALGSEIMGVPQSQIIAAGNSSLSLMHHALNTALRHGLWGDERSWSTAAKPTLIAAVPGYDRHFTLSEALGINLTTVDMTDEGPNLEQVKTLIANDATIKGIWCVPKYSNPTGCTYSDEVVRDMAELPKLAAVDDFVVLWDNAYAVHDLEFPGPQLASIYDASIATGTEDHVVQFGSTSKITFAGGGIAFVASSDRVLAALEAELEYMTIGPDKVNQLRHSRFLKGRVEEHMRAHAELLRPKFKIVLDTLDEQLGDLAIASWTRPTGGYFVSLDVQPGLASKIIQLASAVGLKLTPAGATFPYGQDPEDKNVRIAPTYADLDELKEAMLVLTLCVKLATAQTANE